MICKPNQTFRLNIKLYQKTSSHILIFLSIRNQNSFGKNNQGKKRVLTTQKHNEKT